MAKLGLSDLIWRVIWSLNASFHRTERIEQMCADAGVCDDCDPHID